MHRAGEYQTAFITGQGAEESPRPSDEQFREIVERFPVAMLVLTRRGEITLVNASAESIFGYPRRELLGQSVEILILKEPGQSPLVHPAIGHNPGAPPAAPARDLTGRRKDGSTIPVEICLSTITTSQGEVVLAAVTYLTARRQAEAEARQHRAELAHLSRVTMLGELSGSLAHELNQPLAAILSNAEAGLKFLENPTPDLDELRAIFRDIVDDDSRAGEVIRRLRLLLKKGELTQQQLDVNDVIRNVLKLMQSDLTNRSVTVGAELSDNLPAVSADRVQLQQVLLNLIINACDAMATRAAPHGHLIVRTAHDPAAGLHITIADQGAGIPPQNLERVFDSFFTTKPGGMGLGLAVCRTIISAHGGRMWATNNPDPGATFHVLLPTVAPKESHDCVGTNHLCGR